MIVIKEQARCDKCGLVVGDPDAIGYKCGNVCGGTFARLTLARDETQECELITLTYRSTVDGLMIRMTQHYVAEGDLGHCWYSITTPSGHVVGSGGPHGNAPRGRITHEWLKEQLARFRRY